MAWAAAHPFSASALAPRAFCTSDSVYLDAGDGDHVCREAALREALADAERVAALFLMPVSVLLPVFLALLVLISVKSVLLLLKKRKIVLLENGRKIWLNGIIVLSVRIWLMSVHIMTPLLLWHA